MTENEKELHAMEFFNWALRYNVLFDGLRGNDVDEWVLDYIELLQLLYNQEFYEACVLCVLLAEGSVFVSSAITDTLQELICAEWKARGTKKMLENFIAKIQAAGEQVKSSARKIPVT